MSKMEKTKQELKIYFFRFHNQATLNGNPSARVADFSVTDIYKRANFPLIVKLFKAEYMKKTPSRLDYSHTLYAQRILKSVLSFIYANQKSFMPVPSTTTATTCSEIDTENITLSISDQSISDQ